MVDISIPLNQATNKSKGLAFVQLESKQQAEKAVKALNDMKYKGRNILVDFAVDSRQYELFK